MAAVSANHPAWNKQCVATVKSTGQRCRLKAIRGGLVCNKHGGSAPQVKAAAEARIQEMRDKLLDLVPQALYALQELLDSPNHSVRLKAAETIVDRFVPVQTKSQVDIKSDSAERDLDQEINDLIAARQAANGARPEKP